MGETMKKKRLLIAIILLLAALLTACADETESSTTLSNKNPISGGEITWALAGTVTEDNLDAHKSGNAQNGRVTRSIYDSLVHETKDGEIEPWLAESWKISEDGKTYTFHLKENVSFTDGTPFDAEAVKFNFDRIKDPATNGTNSMNELGPYESSDVLDKYTVKVNFSKPFAPFLSNAAKSDLGFVSPAAVEKFGEAYPQNPVGTGPFKVKSFTPGTQVVLVKNEDYDWAPDGWGHEGEAYLDKITVQFVPEEATRLGVLQSKQVHAADIVPPQNLVLLRTDPQFNILETELRQINYSMYLNPQKEPWDDLDVRKAVRAALNIESAVEIVYLGTSEQAWSPVTTNMNGYAASVENSWEYNPQLSAHLLEDAGYKKNADGIWAKNGKSLTIDFLDTQGNREKRIDLATVFQNQLKEAGIQLNIVSLSAGEYLERRLAGDYDMIAASQFSGDPDVMRMIFSTKGPNGEENLARANKPELDEWLERGYSTNDEKVRNENYGKAQEYIIENAYSIPTYLFQYSFATVAELKGIEFDSPGFPVFYDAWLQQ